MNKINLMAFCSKSDERLMYPIRQNGRVWASNTHIMISVSTEVEIDRGGFNEHWPDYTRFWPNEEEYLVDREIFIPELLEEVPGPCEFESNTCDEKCVANYRSTYRNGEGFCKPVLETQVGNCWYRNDYLRLIAGLGVPVTIYESRKSWGYQEAMVFFFEGGFGILMARDHT
jgi:hypothetical protein